MTNRILIILPTRGRPFQALEAIASIRKAASHPDLVDIVICQDTDDNQRFSLTMPGIVSVFERRKRFCEWINFGMRTFLKQSHSHVAWAADDVRFLSQGWDELLQANKSLVVYGPDGIHDERMATHPFVRVEIPKALGYLIPPELVHLCADLFIQELGKELGSIAYLPELKIDHRHFSVGKSECDQTYEDAKQWMDRDNDTFYRLVCPNIKGLAQKVKDACF